MSPEEAWQNIHDIATDIHDYVENYNIENLLKPEIEKIIKLTSEPITLTAKNKILSISEDLDEFINPNRFVNPYFNLKSKNDKIMSLAKRIEFKRGLPIIPSSQKENQKEITLKIFISHSGKDREMASALVQLLKNALPISPEDLRCTSTPGNRLAPGARFNDVLSAEARDCDLFIALITKNSIKSIYVLLELGARWGINKNILHIKMPNIPYEDMGPLAQYHMSNACELTDLQDLIDAVANNLKLTQNKISSYQKDLDHFILLVKAEVEKDKKASSTDA